MQSYDDFMSTWWTPPVYANMSLPEDDRVKVKVRDLTTPETLAFQKARGEASTPEEMLRAQRDYLLPCIREIRNLVDNEGRVLTPAQFLDGIGNALLVALMRYLTEPVTETERKNSPPPSSGA